MLDLMRMASEARRGADRLRGASRKEKDRAILALAELIIAQKELLIRANEKDLALAEEAGLTPALIDRLRLDSGRLEGIAGDLRTVARLEDPVGQIFDRKTLPNGLQVHKQRVPLGVLAVIYESRPNVTVDVASLALKSGNAVILRGGSETLNSNRALVSVVREALLETGLPMEAVQFIDSPDQALVMELLGMYEQVDMLIPRGGAGLHKFCRENSRIPVITGGIGVCHLYVDESADQEAALRIVQNAKVQRPSVCNALDTALLHEGIAAAFIPKMIARLQEDGVSFKLDPQAWAALGTTEFPEEVVSPARPEDFDTEWLSLVLGVRVIAGLDEAIRHIQTHSTGHSDGILTRDPDQAERFIREVDSAAVYVNASTRFTDGAQLGLGAEVAISTQRLHARGPMALEALTTYKWVIHGENHVRPD